MRSFRTELKRAFGWPWVFAVVVVWIAFIVENIDVFQTRLFTEKIDSIDVMVNAFNKSSILTLSLFALACPYARSYLADQRSGFLKYRLARTGRASFLWERFCANMIASASTLLFAQLSFLAFCVLCFPYPDLGYYRVMPQGCAMEAIMYDRPALYYILLMLIQLPSSMAWSSLALALSPYIRNQYITLCVPFLLFTIISSQSSNPVIEQVFRACWLVYDGMLLSSEWAWRLSVYFIFFGAMLLLSFGLFYWKVREYDGSTR